jgi:hypothetical protein
LDRDRDVIDCDIMALPELAEDTKTQIEAVKSAWWMTPNEMRKETGFDELPDENMNKIYIGSTLTPLDQVNSDIGGGLTI